MARLSEKEAKELWVKFATAALNGYSPQDEFPDEDELADDMANVSSKCADAMLDEYEHRFCEAPKRRKKAKKAEREEEEEAPESEDDPDLDEDDDE